jgi:hypothetical protein
MKLLIIIVATMTRTEEKRVNSSTGWTIVRMPNCRTKRELYPCVSSGVAFRLRGKRETEMRG